jgi:hypothetical protein
MNLALASLNIGQTEPVATKVKKTETPYSGMEEVFRSTYLMLSVQVC